MNSKLFLPLLMLFTALAFAAAVLYTPSVNADSHRTYRDRQVSWMSYLTEELALDADQQEELKTPMKTASGRLEAANVRFTKQQKDNSWGIWWHKDKELAKKNKRENYQSVDAAMNELNQSITDMLNPNQRKRFTQIMEVWKTKFKG